VKQEYWDSNLFLAYLNDEPDNADIVDALIDYARDQKNETMIVVSTLVLAEIRPRSSYDPDRSRVVKELFYTDIPYMRIVGVTPPIAELASQIGGTHNEITSPDAIHVATALLEGAVIMYTLDGPRSKELRRSGGLLAYDGRIGVPDLLIAPLRIQPPTRPPNSQLPLAQNNPSRRG